MWIELLFYLAFLSQIVLISYYYPKRMLARIDYVFEHCPPDTHAKLYPKGYEKALEGKIVYKLANILLLVIGLIIFTIFIIANQLGEVQLNNADFLPLAFGMVQSIPFFLLEVSALKQLKHMRNLNTDSKRQADLNPRSLFNYISPVLFGSAVFMFLVCILVILKLNSFEIAGDVSILIGSMILCNGLFISIGYILLHGKKLDPHQSSEDRRKMTAVTFRSYASISILVSVFFILNQSVEHFHLDNWGPLFNSLYWQAVVLLSTGTVLKFAKLDEMNFDVYKTTIPD